MKVPILPPQSNQNAHSDNKVYDKGKRLSVDVEAPYTVVTLVINTSKGVRK